MTKIALINPNSNVTTTEMMLAILAGLNYGVEVTGFTAKRAPKLIINNTLLDDSAAEVIEIGRSLHGYDSIIVAAFGDPGADVLQQALTIPVIGIGAAAARAAARNGSLFAVATTTPDLADRIDDLMRKYSDKANYIGTFATAGDTISLMSRKTDLVDELLLQIEEATRSGAHQVIIGGGPLSQAAERLSSRTTVPLVHPLKEALKECIAHLVATKGG